MHPNAHMIEQHAVQEMQYRIAEASIYIFIRVKTQELCSSLSMYATVTSMELNIVSCHINEYKRNQYNILYY